MIKPSLCEIVCGCVGERCERYESFFFFYLVSYEFHPQLCVCWLLSELPVKLFGSLVQKSSTLLCLCVLLLLLRLLLLSLPLQPEGCGGVIHTQGVYSGRLHPLTCIDKVQGQNSTRRLN